MSHESEIEVVTEDTSDSHDDAPLDPQEDYQNDVDDGITGVMDPQDCGD